MNGEQLARYLADAAVALKQSGGSGIIEVAPAGIFIRVRRETGAGWGDIHTLQHTVPWVELTQARFNVCLHHVTRMQSELAETAA